MVCLFSLSFQDPPNPLSELLAFVRSMTATPLRQPTADEELLSRALSTAKMARRAGCSASYCSRSSRTASRSRLF
jgi:hypothetical protein